jgi:hypothetical protein
LRERRFSVVQSADDCIASARAGETPAPSATSAKPKVKASLRSVTTGDITTKSRKFRPV